MRRVLSITISLVMAMTMIVVAPLAPPPAGAQAPPEDFGCFAELTSSGYDIVWTDTNGAASYVVQRSVGDDGPF